MEKKAPKILYVPIILICIFMLIPVFWTIMSSFKAGTDLYEWPPRIIPKEFSLANYMLAFKKGNFSTYFINSFFITITSTILTVIINTMAGFALAKYRFKGDKLILVGFISTLMIPLEVIMIPIFTVISKVGFYDSYLGLIIPPAATPTGLFMIRQFLLSVPDSLLEASRIDGASEFQIFWKVIVPISKPVISVLAIFSFMWRWNDYIWPLIVISDPRKYTVQLAISNFIGEYNVDWNSLLAMSVVTMIPVLIVFLIFQKNFVQGMVTSGMKD